MECTIIVRDFNTTVLAIARRQRQNKDLEDVNLQVPFINQLDLNDIYRTPHPTMVEYAFFKTVHEVFTKTEQC